MKSETYVGITGFGSRLEVDVVRAALPSDRLLMVGVGMCGYPTAWGPEKWPLRYPKPEKIPPIFPESGNVLGLLHFTPHPDCDLRELLYLAQCVGGRNCHGMQLNKAWPERNALAHYKDAWGLKRKTIALPIDGKALNAVGWNPRALAWRLKEYEGLIEYVVLDLSGGNGKELNETLAEQCFSAIEVLMPELGFVVAGGLHADNVECKLRPLLRKREVGSDAESQLRTPNDRLSTIKAIRYGRRVDGLLRQRQEVLS